MGGGGLDYRTLYCGKPTVAFLHSEARGGHIVASEDAGLNAEPLEICLRGECGYALRVDVELRSDPTIAFGHHHQSDIDEFLAFNVGYIAECAVLEDYLVIHRGVVRY